MVGLLSHNHDAYTVMVPSASPVAKVCPSTLKRLESTSALYLSVLKGGMVHRRATLDNSCHHKVAELNKLLHHVVDVHTQIPLPRGHT